jgi:hypothetical protein
VGADYDDVYPTTSKRGSAYVFARKGTTWTQQAKLKSGDGAVGNDFGHSVSVSGDTAIVGAMNDTVGASEFQGSAFVFARSGATWTRQAKLIAADGAANDGFGHSVSVSGATVLAGAPHKSGLPPFGNPVEGRAYVFDLLLPSGLGNGQQCELNGQCTSGLCVTGYCCASSCTGPCEWGACGPSGCLTKGCADASADEGPDTGTAADGSPAEISSEDNGGTGVRCSQGAAGGPGVALLLLVSACGACTAFRGGRRATGKHA